MAINTTRYQIPAVTGVITGTDGSNNYQGTAGLDTAQFDEGRRASVVLNDSHGPVGVAGAAGIDSVSNIETLLFVDGREVYNPEDVAAQISRLYEITLGREADQDGLNTFVSALENGTSLASVAGGMVASAEFTALYGANLTSTQYVNVLYENMRGGDASLAEAAGWVSLIENKTLTLGGVAADISNSPEHRAATADTLASGIWDRDEAAISIANLYDTAFDRLPDLDGLAAWVSLAHGQNLSLKAIAEGFYNSNEARGELAPLSDVQFVQAVYQNALGREAEAGGLSTWVGHLQDASLSRAGVILAISESPEHHAINADLFQSDNPLSYGVSLVA